MREIVDGATAAKRAISPEEQENLDKLDTDYDRVRAEEDKLVAINQKLAAGDAKRSVIQSAIAADEDEGSEDGDAQFMATIRAHMSAIKNDMPKQSERAFEMKYDHAKVLRTVESSRAISDFANSASLYVSDFSTKVAIYQRTASPLFRTSTIVSSDNGRPLILPVLSVDPSMSSPGEGTAITENSGTLGQATATPVSYKALSYISNEAEEDELIGLLGIIAQQQGRQLGFSAGTAMTASLLTSATNGGTAGGLGGGSTAAFFGLEDLIDLKYGRAAPYRAVGGWLMANAAIKKVRKFVDKNGQYLWAPGLFNSAFLEGQPDAFDGQSVFEDPGLAAPASATKSVVYGDLSAWIIKQRGLRVAVSTDVRFVTDEVAIRSVLRAGGALPDSIALAYLVSANT
jgi:HK97 family phage major capsid protein